MIRQTLSAEQQARDLFEGFLRKERYDAGANALKRSVKPGAGGTSESLGTFSQSTVALRTCVLEWRLPASSSQNTSWRVPVESLEIADDCRCDLGGDAGATRRHTLCRNAETSDVRRHRAANR